MCFWKVLLEIGIVRAALEGISLIPSLSYTEQPPPFSLKSSSGYQGA